MCILILLLLLTIIVTLIVLVVIIRTSISFMMMLFLVLVPPLFINLCRLCTHTHTHMTYAPCFTLELLQVPALMCTLDLGCRAQGFGFGF